MSVRLLGLPEGIATVKLDATPAGATDRTICASTGPQFG